MMIQDIADYLIQLKRALAGSDPATIQDALSDAEEHLRTALDQTLEEKPGAAETDILPSIIEKYGTPEEVASAYRNIEERIVPTLARPKQTEHRSFFSKFIGVLAEPRAWGAFLYMLISMFTGLIYFSWAVIGISMSLGFFVMIFGIPFIFLFMASVRGIVLVEGRIVEALLGIRMPRRPVFTKRGLGWWEQFKSLVSESRTWLAIGFMIVHFILGISYFVVFMTLLVFSISGIARPILEWGFNLPLMVFGQTYIYTSGWLMPFTIIAGFITLILTMHLAKAVGRMHGRIAKSMLVRD